MRKFSGGVATAATDEEEETEVKEGNIIRPSILPQSSLTHFTGERKLI